MQNIRDSDNIAQYNSRTVKFSNSFLPDCISKWNVLDSDIKEIEDKDNFKSAIVVRNSCNPLYYIGQRRANIIHCQLRMHCSNLNSHLVSLHVKDDPKCVCSYKTENTKHFLLDCPLYETHRIKLWNTVNWYHIFC